MRDRGDPVPREGRIYGTARFRVPERNVPRAIEVIERFVAHVRTEPGTELYVSLRDRAEPTRFTHLMIFRDEAAERAHGSSGQVGEFTDVLYPLCDGPVEFERFERIDGSD